MTNQFRIIVYYSLGLLLLVLLEDAATQSQEASRESSHRWGPWTGWSSCSVSCGQGVVYRKRLCHNIGGQSSSRPSCRGENKQYKICKNNCTAHYKDYRTVQCEKYNGRYYGGKRYYWEAFINPYSRCELACKAKGPVRYYARFQETVEDGTPCKLDDEAICVQGRCLDVGCDGIAGSGTTVDQCGICGGEGKSCRIISGIYTRRHLDTYGYNPITTIPSGACNINITELAKSRNYIALKVGGEHGLYFLNGNHRLSPSGTVRGAGTEFQYGRSRSRLCPGECLFGDGPTNQDIEVKLLYYHDNPGIMYHFTIPKDKMGSMRTHASQEEPSDRHTKHRTHGHHNHHRSNHGNHSSGSHHGRNEKHTTTAAPSQSSGELNPQQGDMHVDRLQHRSHARRRIIARRRDALGTAGRIQHGQSPQYIPAYDRNQQLRLGSSRRIIPRTYSHNSQRQPVRSAYADRYSNGQYRTNTNQNHASRSQTHAQRSQTQNHGGQTHAQRSQTHAQRSQTHTQSSQTHAQRSQQFLPHSQTLLRTSTDQRSARTHHRANRHRHQKPVQRTPYSSSQSYRRNSNYPADRSNPNYLVNQQNNRLTSLQNQRSASTGGYGYNNIQQIPNNRRIADGEVYTWKISGFSECSRSCGGGVQETEILCVKASSGFVVTEENCDPNQLPQRQRVSCNNQPCPPGWEPGEWTECSSTCGKGIQTRTVECKRRISPTLTISVTANLCLQIPRPAVSRMCELKPCAAWKIGKWEKCSTECGLGERTRSVKCVSIEGELAPNHQCGISKPDHKEICDMGSCAKGWYHTKWAAECNAECGPGHYIRKTYCSADDGSYLPEAKCSSGKKPRTKKSCKQNPPCGGRWFAGPWNKCNATCGLSVKKRDVVCMKKLGSKLHTIVSEVNCVADQRPVSEEICGDTPPCRPEWYMTPWGQCSASCNTGVKTREVKCLDSNLQPSPDCLTNLRPSERQACNKQSCQSRKQAPAAITNRHIQKDAGGGGNCKDYDSSRCLYVKQSRLCHYQFYKQMCCKSCHEYVSEKHH